jgi:hypothetical protein
VWLPELLPEPLEDPELLELPELLPEPLEDPEPLEALDPPELPPEPLPLPSAPASLPALLFELELLEPQAATSKQTNADRITSLMKPSSCPCGTGPPARLAL